MAVIAAVGASLATNTAKRLAVVTRVVVPKNATGDCVATDRCSITLTAAPCKHNYTASEGGFGLQTLFTITSSGTCPNVALGTYIPGTGN